MQVVCEKCKFPKNCENCNEMQRLHMGHLCATCYRLTSECKMCKILREVDNHITIRRQHEVYHQTRVKEEAERDKLNIAIPLGLAFLKIVGMWYIIGKVTERR